MGINIQKRRNGWYKYRPYYKNGKRGNEYLGRATLLERVVYFIRRKWNRRR